MTVQPLAPVIPLRKTTAQDLPPRGENYAPDYAPGKVLSLRFRLFERICEEAWPEYERGLDAPGPRPGCGWSGERRS